MQSITSIHRCIVTFYIKMHGKILIGHGLDLDHHQRLIHVSIKIHYDLHCLACLSCWLFIIILFLWRSMTNIMLVPMIYEIYKISWLIDYLFFNVQELEEQPLLIGKCIGMWHSQALSRLRSTVKLFSITTRRHRLREATFIRYMGTLWADLWIISAKKS